MSIGDSIDTAIEQALSAAVAQASGDYGAPGYDGVQSSGGFLTQPYDDPPYLRGQQRWRTHRLVRRRTPVSVATQLRAALFAGVTWTLEPNAAGGPDAERGVEIVQRGLLDARFGGGTNWSETVAVAADGRYFEGHAVFATALARAADGTIVFRDIAHRPQSTIEQWLRADPGDEATPFVAVRQRSPLGQIATLALDECFYVVNRTGGVNSPAGLSVLDAVAERWDKARRYEAYEGSELFSSLGGTPVARAPLEELREEAERKYPNDAGKIASYVATRVQKLYDFVAKRIKSPDIQQWLALSSATYKDPTTGTYSSIQKWGVETVKGEMQGLAEARTVIRDLDLDIARMLGVEYVFVGGGDTAGTFGMHESKISMLGATLSAESGALARAADDQLARRLIIANGLDPDTALPSLVPSPIATDDVLQATQALVQLNAANLPPDHPARRTIFDRLQLPYQEPTPMSPTLPGFGAPLPPPGNIQADIEAVLGKRGGR